MNYETVFTQVALLFIIIIIGIYASKRQIITSDVNKKLSGLLLNITLPLLIITSYQFEYSPDILFDAAFIILATVIVHIVSILIAKIIFRKYSWERGSVLSFATIFSNAAFMGYPIIDSIYPKTGIFYTSIYVAVFNFFIWSYGIMLFSGKQDSQGIKNALSNPGIIATVLGLVLYVFSVKIPYPLFKAFSMVGSMTTPLSLLIIGFLLSQVNIKKLFADKDLYFAIILRLLFIPLILFFALFSFGIKGEVANILVLVTAMPVAAITVIFSERFNADSVLASKITALSTLLSMLTLPGLIIFVSLFA